MFRYARLAHSSVRLRFREGVEGRQAMQAPPEPVTALVPQKPGGRGGDGSSAGSSSWSRNTEEEALRSGEQANQDGGLRVFSLPAGKGGSGGSVDLEAARRLLLAPLASGGLRGEQVLRMSMAVLARTGFSGDEAAAWDASVFAKAPFRQY